MPFPHENELYNYIVFNPDAIQDGITSQNFTLKPHGGEKCLMTMFAREIVNKKFVYYDADNWLISPMLSGEAQTVLFWANNGQPDPSNIYYPQTIEVYYSDKTNDHAGFKKLETFTHSGGESVSVSSDDCQTAINGVTIDAQHPVDVYTVDGKLVMKNATSLRPLKRGVYVVNGVKIVK